MRLFVAVTALVGGILLLVAASMTADVRRDPPVQNAWLVMARSPRFAGGVIADAQIVRVMVGSDLVEVLVDDLGMVYRISLSPDGRSLVFDTADATGILLPNGSGGTYVEYFHQIFVKPVGDGVPRLLSGDLPNAYAPSWSPDGEWIAFIGGQTQTVVRPDGFPYTVEQYHLYKVRPDGSDLTRMAETIGNGRVQWSPDSTRLVFPAGDVNSDIYIINADGTGLRRLTYDPANDLSPFFSPDGEQIVFLSDRGEPSFAFDVWMMNADGTLPQRLYQTLGSSGAVAWSPNGRAVASVQDYITVGTQFVPRYNIQLTDVETNRTRRASPDDDYDYWAPAWSPPANKTWMGWPVVVLGVGWVALGLARIRWRTGIAEPTSTRFYHPQP